MDSFSVKLILPDSPDFIVTPDTRCIFEIMIPLEIPRFIDTSLPAPPYIGIDATYNGMQILVRPTMRAILSGLLRELIGSDYPVCSLLGSGQDGNIAEANRLQERWHVAILTSMADVDLESGTFKDQFGRRGHAPINAYVEEDDGQVYLMFGFIYTLVQGPIPEGDEKVRAIQFRAEPTLSDGMVIFNMREYPGRGIQSINDNVKRDFKVIKAREDAGLPIVFSNL